MAPAKQTTKAQMKMQIGVQTKVTLEWCDQLPTIPENTVQLLDSDGEEGFWDNWDPEVDKKIIERRLRWLNRLEKHIKATTPLVMEAFHRLQKQAKPEQHQNQHQKQFGRQRSW